MDLTWYGNACFGLQCGDDRILFDPFLELRGGSYAADPQELLEYDTVFVTHGHFDHLYTVAQLLDTGEADISVFCTKQCCRTLEDYSGNRDNVIQIEPGRSYKIGSIEIDVLKGRHIEFQARHLFDTLSPLRMIRYAKNLPFLFQANRYFQEGGESVVFDLHAGGSRILLLGSLALHPEEKYPEGADIVILPYQGNNNLPARAREVLERLKPKTVLLSHFDNAFPPMSRDVDLRPLRSMMKEEYPEIRIVKPTAGKRMCIDG